MLQLWSTAVLGHMNTTTVSRRTRQADVQHHQTTVESGLDSQVESGVPRELKISCHSRGLVRDWLLWALLRACVRLLIC